MLIIVFWFLIGVGSNELNQKWMEFLFAINNAKPQSTKIINRKNENNQHNSPSKNKQQWIPNNKL